MQDLIITYTSDGEVSFECIFLPGNMEMFECFLRYAHNSSKTSFNGTLTMKDTKQACQRLYIGTEDGNDAEEDDDMMRQTEIMGDVKAFDSIHDTVPAIDMTAMLVVINATAPYPSTSVITPSTTVTPTTSNEPNEGNTESQ